MIYRNLLILTVGAFLSVSVYGADAKEQPKKENVEMPKGASSDALAANGPHLCYSARKCEGKVLSNRDKHNCKVKSNGKSWRDQAGAACEAL
ncbi:hypothetical protein [Uliginosibacterium gangwonense]|uniref:hypothetical protein n=1 Tax=Uliginosibacterium gangwonense TaxID=392736 RepID=UPI0012F719DD|nr:hypothetical protein [Uliginosibacterium gangwonense]